MKKWRSLAVMAAALCALAAPVQAAVPGVPASGEGATQGIVAVSHPAAAKVGLEILERGGNAVDAAAGIQLALNVVEPMMSGIGGGGFMMIYLKDQNKFTVIDSREMAPKHAAPDMFLDEDGKPIPFDERHTNGKAVGVPGTLLGVDTALNKYGTMKLPDIIDPSIELAEKGVPVNWITSEYINSAVWKLEKHDTAGNVFVPGGKPLKEGDLLVQPDLAKALKLIKQKGTDAFYKGEIGEALVKEVQRTGGSMTMEDLQHYVVKEREPVRGDFRGYEIVSMPPPSSGGLTVIQILKLMEGFDNQKAGANSVEYLHNLIEANHLAYADRAKYMADDDFYPVPKKGLIHDDYINERRKLILPDKANAEVAAGDPWAYEEKTAAAPLPLSEASEHIYTTHFSVMDKWGNLVLSPRIFSSNYPNVTWEAGIDQDVILALMAKGHVFAEKPGNIGNVQAVVYDFETGKMYGGVDNTREGTVLSVDGGSYHTSKPTPAPQADKGVFTLKVNGNTYPYTAEQKVLRNGTAYIQADKLLLGLNGGAEAFKNDAVQINGEPFLPVKKVAEKLGYSVSWDAQEWTIQLEKK